MGSGILQLPVEGRGGEGRGGYVRNDGSLHRRRILFEAAQTWRRSAGESNGRFPATGNPVGLKPPRFPWS